MGETVVSLESVKNVQYGAATAGVLQKLAATSVKLRLAAYDLRLKKRG